MITPAQCRAGRALVNATQADLAKISNVHVRTIMDFEKGNRSPIPATLVALSVGLEKLGVKLIEADENEGSGARLANP